MQIPCMFNQCTIRQRLILLNSITLVLIVTLVSIYTYQLISLESKLITMERVDDLFSNILEARRYEKNIMLQLDKNNVTKARQSLQKTTTSIEELSPKFNELSEQKLFLQLKESFTKYKVIFDHWCADGECVTDPAQQDDSYLIRQEGQTLADNAAELVHLKRKHISEGFKEILFWLTFMPAVLFICGVILFFSQIRSILTRLSSLDQGTKNLAAGEFKIIPTTDTSPDEISGLIDDFNKMVGALEQKQEELIQSKKMASIGTFSSGIAHEINNPLNNISLSTDIILEEFDSMEDEEIKEILGDIMTQTDRASKIVKNLLDFSRVQSSEMQPVYIDFVLHKTTDLIANELRIHKIALEKDIIDLLPQVNGDLQKLQQVFLNLIINAEQAIGDYGTITIQACKTDTGYVRVNICDTGPGIAQENIDQIFDPFFTTKGVGKGTGLGLSIVYAIVKEHGGYIEVTSKLDEGTTFSVYLPVYHDNENKEQQPI
ncbi:MAG: HAMP domain-containing protein [Proteobacteria bacterium]|nr:HAMP domain-containing protein [Desulfocapsa sp.]MBU3943062.1 HAMP domain-containing protein [Pseudomonadota bacterium]MCG2744208.1 ATP-binding protein [Desulfobacteraceae bacterium]MBU4027456.1 HAMP domain-containing protein [Pseudomonadota bacterium]MBU4044620.1 HAMP domain-containing protein [Pseudomonadota bacterium]